MRSTSRNKYTIRPTGRWEIVTHHPEALSKVEAVLQVELGVSTVKSIRPQTPCEIRLKEQDLEQLLRLPEVQDIARRVMAETTPEDRESPVSRVRSRFARRG